METKKKILKTYSVKYFSDLKLLYSKETKTEEKEKDEKEIHDGKSLLQGGCESID